MQRSEARFHGEAFVDRADLASEWATPGTDLAAGSVAVLADDRIVAWAEASSSEHATVIVDESHWGRGLGTALTRWSEQVLANRGLEVARQVVLSNDTVGEALMVKLGYEVDWAGWSLRLDEGDSISHRELPDGIQIRPFELDDAEPAHAVIEDAFSEWITRDRNTFEAWTIENLHRDGSDVSHHWVAVANGAVVGASVVHDSGDTAWVYQLAVHRDVRGRGIAQELLASSFEAARERGVPRAALATDARTGALGLYESLGMRVVASWNVWRKPLSPSGPAAPS